MHVSCTKNKSYYLFRMSNKPWTVKTELAKERRQVVEVTQVNIRWKEKREREKKGGEKLRFVNEGNK